MQAFPSLPAERVVNFHSIINGNLEQKALGFRCRMEREFCENSEI